MGDFLLKRIDDRRPVSVTWLNHYSLRHADFKALAEIECIGFDGTLLQVLARRDGRSVGRSSADLVLPRVVRTVVDQGGKVVFIGGQPGVARAAARVLAERGRIQAFDGYGDLARLTQPGTALDLDSRLVVVGLGAGLQDQVCVELRSRVPNATVVTSGGWFDQLATGGEAYFPPIVHRMRLGWLWRLAHEPRRLLKRYTVDAAWAVTRGYRTLHLAVDDDRVWNGFSALKSRVESSEVSL